jgi:hypothetical protein
MRYDILKDYEDKDFPVRNEGGEKEPLHLVVGKVFVPAEINYPDSKTAALVADGTLAPTKPAHHAAKKK